VGGSFFRAPVWVDLKKQPGTTPQPVAEVSTDSCHSAVIIAHACIRSSTILQLHAMCTPFGAVPA
jgi:hypothetical protein